MTATRAGFTADLGGVVLVVVVTIIAVVGPGIRETPVRVPLAFAFVLFLPGYALVAALFPGRHDEAESLVAGIGPIERVVLACALSIAVVVLVGIGLVISPIGFAEWAVLLVLAGVTLVATVFAANRRGQLRANQRYRSPFERVNPLLTGAFSGSPANTALSVILVVSVVAVGGVVTYDAVTPTRTSSTDLFLLAPNESGPSTNANYPTTLTEGEGQPLVVGVRNREGDLVNYTIVVVLQRLDDTGENLTTTGQVRLDQFTLRVGANETIHERRTVVPTVAGSNLRLAFLLYRDQPPKQPTTENAYREVHLLIDVDQASNGRENDFHRPTGRTTIKPMTDEMGDDRR